MVYNTIIEKKKKGIKQLAVLIDPDKVDEKTLQTVVEIALNAGTDYFFVGGSLLVSGRLDSCVHTIKSLCELPVILFPGSPVQLSRYADAILFLSLISGRNPEALIGHHVVAAPYIKESGIEVMSTGYLLIDGGKPTTVSYMSNSTPIPADKPDIALCTAIAGELLGLKLIYLDTGSGALHTVSPVMVRSVSKNVDVPVIVGGGIRSGKQAEELCIAGADILVVGTIVEEKVSLLKEISVSVKNSVSCNLS